MFVLIVLNCFKQSPTKTKLAMVQAANQSLRTERDIMLRHPGEKNLFYILFERIIILAKGYSICILWSRTVKPLKPKICLF